MSSGTQINPIINLIPLIIVIILIVWLIRSNTKKKEKMMDKDTVQLTCPRCGYKDVPSKFQDAYSDSTCCCLALIMILPAVLYYFLRQGKKICPKCKNVF